MLPVGRTAETNRIAELAPEPPQAQQTLAERIRSESSPTTQRLQTQDPARWERHTCRACGSGGLVEVLSLGNQPPANAFLHREELAAP